MKYTVIVAEDEELLLKNLARKIEEADPDFQVVGTAQTGSQAYALVCQQNPDLVVSDIRMPVMDGITLLTKIREQFPLTKFIITSGYSDFDYARSAISLKVTDYLLKPVDPDELKNALFCVKKEIQLAQDKDGEAFPDGASRMSPAQIAEYLKDFLVKNYASDVNLNLIAENLNYSPGYLTKLFCQIYGCTPTKYLSNLRIARAQQLLAHSPELTIRQIGEMTGYHDQAYFSRIFKKQTGKSPFEYRETKEK